VSPILIIAGCNINLLVSPIIINFTTKTSLVTVFLTLLAQYEEQRLCNVERLSVRLSHRSTAATAAGGFAAERLAGRRFQLRAPCGMRSPRSAANAGSVTLRADGGDSTQT